MVVDKKRAGVFLEHTSWGGDKPGLVEGISDLIKEHSLDIFLGPEWLFMPPIEHDLMDQIQKENLVDRLAENTKSLDCLVIPGTIMWQDSEYVYNAAPVLYKGELLGNQYKSKDGGTCENAALRKCTKPMHTYSTPRVFDWKDCRFGIDICADMGRMYEFLDGRKLPFLDMYFLVSCGSSLALECTDLVFMSMVPAKPGGYALCSDGFAPHKNSRCLQKSLNGERYSGKEPKLVKGMYIYDLD
ncbi:MAG: hypothetical protein WC471_05285 [Candidatus Woesearchaeota archaeon]